MTTHSGVPAIAGLERLTDDTGLFEHAWHATPRRCTGYCTDDNGRALAIASFIGGDDTIGLCETYLAFLVHAHRGHGSFRLRLGYDRRWTSDAESHDANGRALFGLGVASAQGPAYHVRRDALALFDRADEFRSPYWRATAAAVYGACAVLSAHPDHAGAHTLISDATLSLPRPVEDSEWPWPEPELSYESARLPLALLQTGSVLGIEALISDGLGLLDWLIDRHVCASHLSLPRVSSSRLSAPGHDDQQPVEAWAFADAASMAQQIVPSAKFERTIEMAAAWFEGRNDAGLAMVDPSTGGAYDGLEVGGVNLNQGAESLLSLLATRYAAKGIHHLETEHAASERRC